MRKLFFYGTLRHVPLLEIVLGHDVATDDLRAASLPGYHVQSVAEGPFPLITEARGAVAEGLVIRNLTEADIARFDFYEGIFSYDLVTVTLADGQQAEVYLPQPDLWTALGPWDLDGWAEKWGALSCLAAKEVMGYMGERTPGELAQMFPTIRARAASRLRGPDARHGEMTFPGQVEVTGTTRAYSKYFALDDITLRHERFDGTQTDEIQRAVFVSADAAIVLPYDPATDQVLLVEQIRVGPLLRHDKSIWQLEPIAGRIDAGETPEGAARREAQEEAGITLGALETIAEVYPSPGASSEFYYIFIGLADLSDVTQGFGGLEEEHEDIRTHIISFDRLMTMVADIGVANAPLALCAYWLAHHRDRLRSAEGGVTPEVR
jgi:nudix-type nucleoside diphosphatase (YffH/AdpP family)